MGGSGDKGGGKRGESESREQRVMQTDRWEGDRRGETPPPGTEAQVPGGAAGELGEL